MRHLGLKTVSGVLNSCRGVLIERFHCTTSYLRSLSVGACIYLVLHILNLLLQLGHHSIGREALLQLVDSLGILEDLTIEGVRLQLAERSLLGEVRGGGGGKRM